MRKLVSDINVPALRAEMARRQLTQCELAKRLGISQPTVSLYMNGYRAPPPDFCSRVEWLMRLPKGSLAAPSK